MSLEEAKPAMQYRVSPKTGERISALGLGCMRFPGYQMGRPDQRAAEAIISRAVERGITYLDTAYLYPGNEACVGLALERLGMRDRVDVATKLPHASCKVPGDLNRIFIEQLRRLRTDRVDYYLIHNVTSPAQWERLRSLGVEDWIARRKESGRIRNIGFSFHGSGPDFPVLLDAFDWDFCQIQYNYANERYQAGTAGLRAAAGRGIAVFVMEPLLGGRLAGKLPDAAKRVLNRAGTSPAPAVVPVPGSTGERAGGEVDAPASVSGPEGRDCGEGGAAPASVSVGARPAAPLRLATPADWALAWVWDHPEVTMLLSGMGSPEEVDANADLAARALPGCLTEAQHSAIAQVVEVFDRANRVSCTGCNYCMPCPRDINIPGCFSAYNASYAHGWFTGIQQYFTAGAVLTGHPRLVSNCVRCGKCARHCPQGIDIPARLDEVRRRFQPGPVNAVLKMLAHGR